MPRTKSAPTKRVHENNAVIKTTKKQRTNVHDIEINEKYVVLSTQGKRKSMEDSYDVYIDDEGLFNIFSVFDGHGGYECAEFCSLEFNKKLYKNIINQVATDKNNTETTPILHDIIKKTFDEIDHLYCKLCQTDNSRIDGSTATVVIHDLKNNVLHCGSVGDSRAILFRYGYEEDDFNNINENNNSDVTVGSSNDSNEVKLLNGIHLASGDNEMKRIVQAGGKIVNTNGVPRVEGVLMVSRAIGDAYLKKLIISEPDTSQYKITKEEQERIVVIGSDGLFDFMEPSELCGIFRKCEDLNDIQSCVQRSVGTSISRGSTDNVTLIAIPICERLKNKKRSDSLCS